MEEISMWYVFAYDLDPCSHSFFDCRCFMCTHLPIVSNCVQVPEASQFWLEIQTSVPLPPSLEKENQVLVSFFFNSQ